MSQTSAKKIEEVSSFMIAPYVHPQGCRGYLLVDKLSGDSIAIDVHLDFVNDMTKRLKDEYWNLLYVIDTHTHADHPSGSSSIAKNFNCLRMAHKKAEHSGVSNHPENGEELFLGESTVFVRHTPGHTPDHMGIYIEGAFFSGDSLLIGSVARTDFLGGDAGQLYDSIHSFLKEYPGDTVLFPGHDYQSKTKSTFGEEKKENPWLKIEDREEFIKNLTANPPERPANMDELLHLNREGVEIAKLISSEETKKIVEAGGAISIIDVRSEMEFEDEHISGSHLIPLDQLESRADEVRAIAAPRLLLCKAGGRASAAFEALDEMNIGGLSVIDGGILAFKETGGKTVKGKELDEDASSTSCSASLPIDFETGKKKDS
ncbi:MAG: hypothetical protein COA79_09650 [Planctomycetota bacterium]|nr:MAG: hypothetical protein COA79_09650 [Planctomycetota bacterium]